MTIVRLYPELPLENPVLTAGWSGTGDAWTVTVHTMRETLETEELGELEHPHSFNPIASLDPQERVRIPLAR